MITIRIAGVAAALVTFWLAAIGWTVLIVAAPANAETGTTSSSGSSSSSDQSSLVPFPEPLPHRDPQGTAAHGNNNNLYWPGQPRH